MKFLDLGLTEVAIIMLIGAAKRNALNEPIKKTVLVEDLTL